jgi:hypothetical protein
MPRPASAALRNTIALFEENVPLIFTEIKFSEP